MEKIIVEKQNEGIRIDKFLAKEFFLYTRGEIIKAIRSGKVLVNNGPVKPSYVLEIDDLISVLFPREKKCAELEANRDVVLQIVYEDKDILIINKQAGIQVHPDEHEKKYTIVNGLIARYPDIVSVHDESREAQLRPGIVHRLDKDTSGVMVIAKNLKSFQDLKNKFQTRRVNKQYLAIGSGVTENKEGVIDKAIAKSSDYKRQTIASNRTKTTIRSAVTRYKILSENNGCSLIEVAPKTGRMHQIRLHLASIGLPIIGDKIYGRKDCDYDVERQMLHAHSLEFELFKKKHSFEAKIPEDFEHCLDKISLQKDKI